MEVLPTTREAIRKVLSDVAPEALCCRCVALRVRRGLTGVRHAASQLEGLPSFSRGYSRCVDCARDRLVLRMLV